MSSKVNTELNSVRVSEQQKIVICENNWVKISFDLKDGNYTGTDKMSAKNIFEDAQFRLDYVGNMNWNQPSTTYEWKEELIKDEFGSGISALFFHKPEGKYKPLSILIITLYDNHPFINFKWGVENTHAFPIRVREVELLFGGELFTSQEMKDPKVLRGGAGAEPNFVEDTWQIEAYNSALLTFKDGESRCSIVAGGLHYNEFARRIEILDGIKQWNNNGTYDMIYSGFRQMTLACWDPQGKRIEPNSVYISQDSFYLDISTPNPFIALEKYGQAMRIANNAHPNTYDFPTLCGWMVSTASLGEGKPINNSPGLVEQVEIAQNKGFMKYTKLAVRLEPDYYCYGNQGDTQQGWWDDKHWAQYGSLNPPYETFLKWCTAVKERGGIPFTYFQASLPSNDFALAHPDWMLNNDVSLLHVDHAHHRPLIRYDYTDPEFRAHALAVWKRLYHDGLQGVKFDYPETGWAKEGGFEDQTFTTTSAYREIYRLCREGLGGDAFIHERNLGGITHENAPRLDVTAGIVDLQRVWDDSSHFEPEMASRIGLRWYKNRSVFQYYPDGKSLYEKGKKTPLPTHKRRMFLTLIGLLSGRLELGTSIGSMNPEMIHDITRLYPMIKGTKSPRPVDMFTGKKHPEIYRYAVTPEWLQVIIINNDLQKEQQIKAPMSGDQIETGSLDLDPMKEYHIFDFWNQKYFGKIMGTETITISLKPEESRVLSIREVQKVPQIISTNRHIMQGLVELMDIEWDETVSALRGIAKVIGGEDFIITVAQNGKNITNYSVNSGECVYSNRNDGHGLIDLCIRSEHNHNIAFEITFL